MQLRRVALGLTSLVALAAPLSLPATQAGATAAPASATAPAHWVNHDDVRAAGVGAPSTPDPTNPAGCDPIGGWTLTDGHVDCMLPFPNDWFTTFDAASETDRRLDLNPLAMPVNYLGKPIDPTDWNSSDGFAVGSQLLAYVPGMTSNADLAPSGLPTDAEIGTYADPDAGVVVIDTTTGKRWPVWAEVDQYVANAGVSATGSNPEQGTIQKDLMIHPATNFLAGHTYVVALRHLHTDDGSIAQPSAAFAAYRDGTATDARAQHMNDIFDDLAEAGVARSDLYLAWDFTTASTENTTGRLKAMRDDAFASLGDTNLADGKVEGSAPTFSLTSTTDDGRDREIKGTFQVPCYITPSCLPTGKFALPPDDTRAVPSQTPAPYTAQIDCEIPDSVYTDTSQSARPSLYGHGLFGQPSEVEAGNVKDMAAEHDMLECGTEWYGMSLTDVPNAIADMEDLSNFGTLVDRTEQGELDFLFLARLMVHPDGLCSSPYFQRADGSCVINRATAYYDGNSQGGIYGGTVCAMIPDATRCVLGVTGEDYALLLPRSSDYVAAQPLTPQQVLTDAQNQDLPAYSAVLDTFYPEQDQRMLVLDLMQTLWDRSDPDGYAQYMTTHPLPDTPAHHVLMQIGWGDHQVANVMALTEARTVGADIVTPTLVPQRFGDWTDPFWGLTPVPSYPYDGSAITVFDSGPVRTVNGSTVGTNPPPLDDEPNRSGEDPHELPRSTVCGRIQKSDMLSPGGVVTHPCGDGPYFSGGWNGSDGLVGADLPETALPALMALAAVATAGALVVRRRRRAA